MSWRLNIGNLFKFWLQDNYWGKRVEGRIFLVFGFFFFLLSRPRKVPVGGEGGDWIKKLGLSVSLGWRL